MKTNRHIFKSLFFLFSVTFVQPTLLHAAAPCPQGGDTGCGAAKSTPASTSRVNRPASGVGNPINVITGNKYQREIDYAAVGGVASLLFNRHYNSLNTTIDIGLGVGWRHSFDLRLKNSADQRFVEIIQSDGRRIAFTLDTQSNVYKASSPSDGYLASTGKWPTWFMQDGRRIIFNGNFPTKIIYPGNRSFSLSYKGKGRARKLSKVIDHQGRILTLTYSKGSTALANFSQEPSSNIDLAGHLKSITLPNGKVITYHYDTDHNLARVLYPDGTSRVYHYEDVAFPNYLTGITDRTGKRFATWGYDDEGRANLSEHANGVEKVSLEYKIPEQVGKLGTTIVTNALGQKSTYRWKFYPRISQSLLISSEGPGCSTCPVSNRRYSYDNHYQLKTITDIKTQNVTRYTYDEQGRTLKISSESIKTGGDVLEKLVARYEYEGNAIRPSLIARPSVNLSGEHMTRIRYNADLLPIEISEQGYSPNPHDDGFSPIERTTKLSYTNGNLTRIDGPREDVEDVINLAYDQHNRLQSLTQADGQTLKVLAYDVNGHPTQIQKGTQTPLLISYDSSSNGSSQIKTIKQRNRSIAYRYDKEGRLTQIDTLMGEDKTESIQMAYDDAGRLDTLNDDKGRKIQQIHDAESRPTVTKLMGSNGNVLNTISYLYDAQGRLDKTTTQNLDGETQTDYQYDEKGQLTKVEKNGQAVNLSYNNLGQLLGLTQPGDVVTQFSYDNKGQSTALTDARDNKTQTIKDDFGRTVQHISPDTGTNLYAYDKAGNRIKREDPEGTVTTYQWNAANKLTQKQSKQKNGKTELTTFAYDNATGKLASTTNPNTTESFKYNQEGQLIAHTREIDGHTFTTQYEYNEFDQLKKKTLPDGQTLRYHYYSKDDSKPHQIGKLRAITRESLFGLKQENIISEIDNDKTDNETSYLSHNGLKTQYTYRDDGQLKNIQIADTLKLKYSYDQNGNITGIDENGTLQNYLYDQGRLTFANTLTGTYAYNYDKVGNRTAKIHTQKTGEINASSYAYSKRGKGNRLLNVASTKVKNKSELPNKKEPTYKPYSYNKAGSPSINDSFIYEYNADQRPIKVFKDTKGKKQLLAKYKYNSFGERVKKVTYSQGKKSKVTYYFYDSHTLTAEANEQGEITSQYIYLNKQPIAKFERKQIYAIHSDHLGTPRLATNDDKQAVWKVSYSPFGKATVETKKITLNLRFSGQYEDAETGIYYNYLRGYNPNTGRYLTSDPIGLRGGINIYAYVEGNPLSNIDPLGLATFFDGFNRDFLNQFANEKPVEYQLFKQYATSISTDLWIDGDFKMYELAWRNFESFAKKESFKLISRGIYGIQESIYGSESWLASIIGTAKAGVNQCVSLIIGVDSDSGTILATQDLVNLLPEAQKINIYGPQYFNEELFIEAFNKPYDTSLDLLIE